MIIFTAGLSFLVLGVPPDVPEWGRLLADGTQYLQIAPWPTVAPSVFLVVTVIGVNLGGRLAAGRPRPTLALTAGRPRPSPRLSSRPLAAPPGDSGATSIPGTR